MSRRKEPEPLEKETINLFRGDFEKLQTLHPTMGAGKVIRLLVRAHLDKVQASAEQETQTPRMEVELP